MPLREVQEAESLVAELRASLRSAGAGIGAFGVEPPAETADSENGAAASSFALRSPVAGLVMERAAVLGQMLARLVLPAGGRIEGSVRKRDGSGRAGFSVTAMPSPMKRWMPSTRPTPATGI